MFLDDELYECVKNTDINDAEEFIEMVNKLYQICEKHYKAQLPAQLGTPMKNISIIMDRTFASWDLFVNRLVKEKHYLAPFFNNHPTYEDISYKTRFLENEQLAAIYWRGKEK